MDASDCHFLRQDYWPGEHYPDPPAPYGHPSPLFKSNINNKTVGQTKWRVRRSIPSPCRSKHDATSLTGKIFHRKPESKNHCAAYSAKQLQLLAAPEWKECRMMCSTQPGFKNRARPLTKPAEVVSRWTDGLNRKNKNWELRHGRTKKQDGDS